MRLTHSRRHTAQTSQREQHIFFYTAWMIRRAVWAALLVFLCLGIGAPVRAATRAVAPHSQPAEQTGASVLQLTPVSERPGLLKTVRAQPTPTSTPTPTHTPMSTPAVPPQTPTGAPVRSAPTVALTPVGPLPTKPLPTHVLPPTETPTVTPQLLATLPPTATPTPLPLPSPTPSFTPSPAPPPTLEPPPTVSRNPPTATPTVPPTPLPLTSATPTPTLTASLLLPTPTATATIGATVGPLPDPRATLLPPSFTPPPKPTAPIAVQPPPRVLITEVMANPAAVSDANGEWFELYNAESTAINLLGWTVTDLGGDSYLIATDLILAPGAYAVLARNGDSATNGGVSAARQYSGITLGNTGDELILSDASGTEVDRVEWGGGTGLSVTAGASLERTGVTDPAAWVTAHAPWPGSAGDLGSPGAAYVPPPTATPTLAPTPLPNVLITEVMANPAAASDANGEYIELWNGADAAVNLNGWMLTDLGTDSHTIAIDLVVPPGGYVVLARNGDPTINGGVPVDYVYSGVSLSNGADEVLLLAPDGTEVDRVEWGTGLSTSAGASLERTNRTDPAQWATAETGWIGSAGDLGSPGTIHTALPTPTPSPTIAIGPTHMRISEVMADPAAVADSAGEWFELQNSGGSAVNLRGWTVIDLGTDSYTIPTDLWVAPGAYVVLGINGDVGTNGGVPVDHVYSGIGLSNSADELILLAPDGTEIDRLVWGDGSGLSTSSGASLELSADATPAWNTAQTPWPGSAGDFGSPGKAAGVAATPTPSATLPSDLQLYISEVLADPAAVDDSVGEWIEIHNPNAFSINLLGWTLADLGSDAFLVDADVPIAPGGYAVLARNGDPLVNGGVNVAYVYSGMSLSNGEDEVILRAPDGREVDRVMWGGASALRTTSGVSLERANLSEPAAWTPAQQPWSGSAGDWGTPGGAPVPVATPTPTATLGPVVPLYISEVMADPAAVADSDGEWIEIYNPHSVAVNLRGWTLTDLGSDSFVIDADVSIAPGGYVVLARNGDPATNGGVPVEYVYSGMSLSNGADEVILLAPDGTETDRVAWGTGTELRSSTGASLERVIPPVPAAWVPAQLPWPGSAGDLGSPGAVTVVPAATPSPTPTSSLPGQWTPTTDASPVRIDEVAYRGSDEEFIALINVSGEPVDLAGWSVGDAQAPGSGEGLYALPARQLFPGEIFVVARNGAAFRAQWGQPAHAQTDDGDPDTPTLERRRELASGSLALSDSGDEVVLLNSAGELADAVAFGSGEYAALGLSGSLSAATGFTLQRVPPAAFPHVADVRHRFLSGPPEPFAARTLPGAQPLSPPSVDGGLLALWGTLGAHSNFSDGYTAPPHYVAAAAAANGLHFLAPADPAEALYAPDAVDAAGEIAWLRAWEWQGSGGERAVVYGAQTTPATEASGFLSFLRSSDSLAQWQSGHVPRAFPVVAIGADGVEPPADLDTLYDSWFAAGLPLLPAGNSNPSLPGIRPSAPSYTGLAAPGTDAASIRSALAARRGWLTNRPGLWLSLGATLPSGEWRWMGEHAPAANEITLHVHYGDLGGEVAGLALWQNERPLAQLDVPPADGRWSISVPAIPGSYLYAVATQLDGDFAVTAPIRILPGVGGAVVINEVLPAPEADHNGDGVVNSDDEFIELYNTGTQPIGLAGWQLADDRELESTDYRFDFAEDRYIGGGEYMLLWRSETWLNLNDGGDYVRLLDALGNEVDVVRWNREPVAGQSLSRVPDGEGWHADTPPTPGESNLALGEESDEPDADGGRSNDNPPPTPSQPDPPTEKKPELIAPRPDGGSDGDGIDHAQAAGPSQSIAEAKRLGLERWVEFRARVVVPPGLFNSSIYVADPAPSPNGTVAGIGIQVYLWRGSFPELQEGDHVMVRGMLDSFRGEMEVVLQSPEQIWRIGPQPPLQPLPIAPAAVSESLEGRLVTFTGAVSGWSQDSIYLIDPADPSREPVRVTVRSSLGWRRPYVNKGELWQVTGIVSQLGWEAPWNDGYRVLVRYENELTQVETLR